MLFFVDLPDNQSILAALDLTAIHATVKVVVGFWLILRNLTDGLLNLLNSFAMRLRNSRKHVKGMACGDVHAFTPSAPAFRISRDSA
jgi:hypothetical protein